jgi:AcrR family transcriptional regulator
MAAPLDQARRAELLDGVLGYIATSGLSDLTLRPLAESLGTSARMLIHYFGSKDQMLVAALERHRPRVDEAFADIQDVPALRQRLWAAWVDNTVGGTATSTSVVLQVLGDACAGNGPLLGYANAAIHVLVNALTDVLARIAPAIDDPEAAATLLVSGLRGLLLDRLITSDTDRVDRAALALINTTVPAP